MQKSSSIIVRIIYIVLLICTAQNLTAQNLKITDFAIWGGGAIPNPYNSAQGVFINNNANIQGNIGSNHLININNNFNLTGNIYSGNRVIFADFAKITGNIFANKIGSSPSPTISGNNSDTITGNLIANGKISLLSGKIIGQVAVPAPANTNYTGPVPSGGVVTTFTLPTMPIMPTNTPFDNRVGTTNLTTSQTISPGIFGKMALTGNKTLTFNGPGNYIFYEVDNGKTTNKFVFNFKNTTSGTINIFIIKDARFGVLSVSTINGNFPSRIYTEVHGNGSTFSGNSFDLQAPASIPAGSYVWLGNVWAPNGGIYIYNTLPSATPHIIGALWSGKLVTIKNDLKLVYIAPAADPSYITPYYPPPVSGKVDAANNVIGAELFSLLQNPVPINPLTLNEIFRFDNSGRVMIEVISKTDSDDTLKAQLINLGLTGIIDNGPDTYVISGFFPINNLSQLNNTNLQIQYVRPLYPPIANGGQVTTQGDTTMRSHFVRSRFGLDGSGVKVGVISDSYNSNGGAQNDVDQGDLPGIKSSAALPPNENLEPVQALSPDPSAGHDEGRAMLQIIHDVAPKAKLAFRTGFLTPGHFAKSIKDLASPTLPGGRCDVIVDDITYITEPFLRDGKVAQTVNQVVTQGVSYYSSAGNFGQQSYESVFNGVSNTSIIGTGKIHQFGSDSTKIYQTVNLKPGSYTIVLQWSDEFHSLGSAAGVESDMDLYLVGATGFTLFGFNRSNLFGDPFEVCPFTVTEETNAKLMVVRAAGTGSVRFKYIIFRGNATMMDYQTGRSSVVGHANADSAIAVGAMLYANIPAYTPIWPGVASFSSRGGTFTLKPDNTFSQRNKPEIIGPNGVNTTVNLGGPIFTDGDSYPNFFGTSAAAPHVAAVGALLIQGRKKFNLQPTVSPAEIRQQLVSSAGKFSNLPGNFSFEGGYGYAQADSAIAQIANARPIISTLEAVVPGAQNGTQPFDVKIKGKYLTVNTQIYYYGKPVRTIVSVDKTEATATIPAIRSGQDPPFQIYNPSKSPSKLDGGLSEALHFFSSIVDITVRASNKSRKYGQSNPVFTADVFYNGVLTTNPDTLAKLKLDGTNLTYITIATSASNAGLYGIFPSRTTPLADTDRLLTNYGFTFVSGTLSVGKMPLKITPNNKQVTYGQDIGEITYTYQLDTTGQRSDTSLINKAIILHKKYLAGNGLIVLNKSNQDAPIPISDLANMSTMASFQAVRNARKYVLNDGQLQPLLDSISPSMIDNQRFFIDVANQSLQNYKMNSDSAPLVQSSSISNARGFLNIKALVNGNAKANLNGQLQAMVNGQLQAMVNGQSLPIVNGQLQAMVNGQLQAMVNGQLQAMVNGQLFAMVNGQLEIVQDLTLSNVQLQALVNGTYIPIANDSLKAMVNGVLTNIPTNGIALSNGQLQAMVNGQLQAMVNGQLQAMVNGVPPLINGTGVGATSARQLANGQLQAMVNGTYIPITSGQLQAMVNGQLLAMVNGQLMTVLANGELTFVVFNGQLQAMVNGQLQAMVNGQLQAMVNGQLQVVNSYSIINGQLQAMVNGENDPWVYANGQLLAMVNGQLQAMVNNFDVTGTNNNSKTLVLVDQDDINLQSGDIGTMFAVNMITGLDAGIQTLVPGAFVNENFEVTYGLGQIEILKAPLTGQIKDTTREFGDPNPAFTITYYGLAYNDSSKDITTPPVATTNATINTNVGTYTITIAGGSSNNYSFAYLPGTLTITQKALTVTADDQTKIRGSNNPALTITFNGLAGDDTKDSVCITYIIPPSPRVIQQLNRSTTYTNVRLDNGSNIINANPGQSITLTGSYNSVYYDPNNYCPGCITQIHIGMSNGNGGNLFNDCIETNGAGNPNDPNYPKTPQPSGTLNTTFTAPTIPGVYYLTQESTWWYWCGQYPDPVHNNVPDYAIAVVFVNVAKDSITASTKADSTSLPGNYPITLTGCNSYNPNYSVRLVDGNLLVKDTGATAPTFRSSKDLVATSNTKGSAKNVTTGGKTVSSSKQGISEISLVDKLYPNPGSSLIRLELTEDVQQTEDIQLYDIIGKINRISVKRINAKIYKIDVSKLSRGVYFMKVKTAGGLKTFRFVKM